MTTARPLHDQVALVTGASRNIGRSIALKLAEAGASILLTGHQDEKAARRVRDEIKSAGGYATYAMGDVSDPATAQAWIDAAIAAYGRLDILINNAAIRRNQAFETMTLEQWHEINRVVVDGAFLCARAAIPHMLVRGAGCIVNIGGISGHIGAINRTHVVTAKAALTGLTKGLAVEFAERGIRVNCVAPGLIDTVRGASAGAPPVFSGGTKGLLAGRGTADHVAAMVRHLCLPDSDFITGQIMHVNGGAYLAGA